MPELPQKVPQTVEYVKGQIASGAENLPSLDQLTNTLYEENPQLKLVAMGSHNLLIEDPLDANKLIAFGLRKQEDRFPLEHAEIYYIHRILHVLFPKNFPQLYASFYKDNEQTVRRRIIGEAVGKKHLQTGDVLGGFREAFGIRQQLIEQAKKFGIDLKLDMGSPNNFLTDKEGNAWYVDIVENRSDNFFVDEKAAEQHIRATYVNSPDTTTADNLSHELHQNLLRLGQLREQRNNFHVDEDLSVK